MSDYLPGDVLIEILSRLPVKSLLRFTCVCRQWYSLITNPNFISTHLNQSLSNAKNDSNQLLLVRHYNMFQETERFVLHLDDDSFDEYEELQCSFRIVNEYFRIVGTCNGLICLSDDYDTHTDTIILWNPSVRKHVILPKPQFHCVSGGVCLLGFGFDAINNDYKVVRIVYQHNIPDDHNYKVPPLVEIYTQNSGNWRNICDIAPNTVLYNFFPLPGFLNGSVHWIGSGQHCKDSSRNLIAAFDMVDEVFRDIMMPDILAKTDVLKLSISVLGTSLTIIQYEKIWQSDYCWVWTMKEYGKVESWAKLLTIDMREGIRKVVGFRKKNKVMLSARVRGLICYDPNVQETEYLGIHGTNRSFYVSNYVESLALFKGENRALRLASSQEDPIEGETLVSTKEDRDGHGT
ncbi:hypothetical protein NMG60_11003223 [Bertholletia excelsa]